jgi:hypothetical protein
MSFQTIASDAVLRSQEIWRLNQTVESSGDIFEQDVSSLAMAIGPDSDFASVKVTYYDPLKTEGSSLRCVSVGVGNPFIGRIDALNATLIPGSNIKGTKSAPAKLMISLEDLVDNSYIPYGAQKTIPGPIIVTAEIVRAIPKIDLISYITSPRGLLRERPAKQFNFDVIPQPGTWVAPIDPLTDFDTTYFMVPYYGRRFARATIVNQSGVGNDPNELMLCMRGITLNEGAQTVAGGNVSGQVDLGTARIPAHGTVNLTTFAREDGVFDLLQVEVVNTNNITIDPGDMRLQVDVSDRES